MKIFFGILLGIVMILAGGLCIPFSQKCTEKSCDQMEKFWRWRGLGVVLIILAFFLIGLGFFVIAKSID